LGGSNFSMISMTRSTFNQQAKTETFELDDLAYDLPDELIAQKPSEVRHESRLLHLNHKTGEISHHQFSDIKNFLKTGDVLIVNDTRVVPSRLYARRQSGGVIRLLLVRPQAEKINLWEAMVTPIKRLQIGEELTFVSDTTTEHKFTIADIILDQDGFKRLIVDLGKKEDVYNILQEIGYAPLPPYIVREKAGENETRLHDLDRYQTVFAKTPGAVAAPTAGLHFSSELLEELEQQGVIIKFITLHVGPGTFKPIGTDVANHSIEAELFSISKDTADAVNAAKEEGRRVVAVGTTSLRALETAGRSGRLEATDQGSTTLYVKPGFEFKIIDAMITNFHLSKSSLLVLVATLAGKDNILKAYKEAVEKRYRFFSYGDAMFIS
jgi:S-adenosylmethionine:tRNA ribosyltransferase-isomerase